MPSKNINGLSLSTHQVKVLRLLTGQSSYEHGLTVKQIARTLGKSKQDVVPTIRALERRGLVSSVKYCAEAASKKQAEYLCTSLLDRAFEAWFLTTAGEQMADGLYRIALAS